jgi:glycine/D-amino acid oxidase-like deaminating enzyme
VSEATDPFWWEAFAPPSDPPDALPSKVDVLIVGAGYTGVSCALTLAEEGVDVLVLDAGALGSGASTRSGGQVSGGVNIAKALPAAEPGTRQAKANAALLRDAAQAMTYLEELMERHRIDCDWKRTGRITGCWTPAHYAAWERRLGDLNEHAASDASMVTPAQMRAEIGSHFYHGGLLVRRAGHLHPAKLYSGLLRAARAAGALLHGLIPVAGVERRGAGFAVGTAHGEVMASEVVVATNGYSSDIATGPRSSVVAVMAHMIATEELPPTLAKGLIPNDRAIVDSRRVVNHFRMSPDRRRIVFGGRGRFVPTAPRKTAEILRRQMLDRFPQLSGVAITHNWSGKVAMTADHLPGFGRFCGLHYALGCNGSGVTMMPYLGHCVAKRILGGGDAVVSVFEKEDAGAAYPAGAALGVPLVGSWYQLLDAADRWRAGAPAASE